MNPTRTTNKPHLRPLLDKMQALVELAEAMVERGRADGESVDYAAFEEEVAMQRTWSCATRTKVAVELR